MWYPENCILGPVGNSWCHQWHDLLETEALLTLHKLIQVDFQEKSIFALVRRESKKGSPLPTATEFLGVPSISVMSLYFSQFLLMNARNIFSYPGWLKDIEDHTKYGFLVTKEI